MQLPSASVIATWPTPNYTHPVTRGPANLVVVSICFPLAVLVVALRVYTRLRITKGFGADDALIVASLFPATAFTIITLLVELRWGLNRHVWDVPVDMLVLALKIVLTIEVLFTAAAMLIKLSMLAMVYRIVGNTSKRFRRFTLVAMVLIAAQGITFCITVILQCSPVSAYWTLSLKPQHCFHEGRNLLAAGIVNTSTDLLVVLLPIPTVWGLKLPRRQQVILVILFSAGLFVVVAGAVRTYWMYRLTETYDRTWMALPEFISSTIELYIGMVCASVPSTKPLFTRYIPKLLGSSVVYARRSKSEPYEHIMTSPSVPSTNSDHFDRDVEPGLPCQPKYSFELTTPASSSSLAEQPDGNTKHQASTDVSSLRPNYSRDQDLGAESEKIQPSDPPSSESKRSGQTLGMKKASSLEALISFVLSRIPNDD